MALFGDFPLGQKRLALIPLHPDQGPKQFFGVVPFQEIGEFTLRQSKSSFAGRELLVIPSLGVEQAELVVLLEKGALSLGIIQSLLRFG